MSDPQANPSAASRAIFEAINGMDRDERGKALLQNLGFTLTFKRPLYEAERDVEHACEYLMNCLANLRKGTSN